MHSATKMVFITIYFLYSVILLNLICVCTDFKEDRTTYYCVVLLEAFGRVFLMSQDDWRPRDNTRTLSFAVDKRTRVTHR
jgi:hypothetical protein